jgi:hypothetical protein
MTIRKRMIAALLAAALPAGAAGAMAAAQEPAHRHAATLPDDGLTAKARAQIAEARRAVAPLGTPEAARAAGYSPMFGNVPLQGEHFVRMDLVRGDRFDPSHPSVLIFAPVDGRPALVGAAYAYLHPTRAAMPEGFDGAADHWHTHDDLTDIPGKHLVMTHLWFVPAPDGPFARYNPSLPFLAAGLAPVAVPADAAGKRRVREVALALALVTAPPRALERAERAAGPALAARLEPHRAAIRALVPAMKAAQRSNDRAAFDRLSADAAGRSRALVAVYRDTAGSGWARRALDRELAEFFAEEHAHAGHGG